MKKIIAVMLAVIMMLAFAGCGETQNEKNSVLKMSTELFLYIT